MKRTLLIIQGAASAAIAWLSARLGILFPVLAIMLIAMVVDYVTGMLASKTEAIDHPGDPNYGWNSRKGVKGILKKVGYLCVIAVAMMVDYVLLIVSAQAAITLPAKVFFGLLVTIWFILNEFLSIIENAGRMGAPIPDWLRNYIAILRDKINNEAEKGSAG